MKLKIDRQQLNDLSIYFLPFMLQLVEARLRQDKGTEQEFLDKICRSILVDIDTMFKRKLLTLQVKFKIHFTEAEGIVLLQFLLKFPIPGDHFWRNNLRNQIIQQLHKQLV